MRTGNFRFWPYTLASASVLLAVLSVANYKRDLTARGPAQRFVRQFSLDRRRPFYAETVRLAPAGDLALGAAADAALADALGSVQWTELDPSLQETWLESIGHIDEELRVARDLVCDAVSARPGWAYHRFLLGALDYAAKSRSHDPDLVARPELWQTPLDLAATAAPGDDTIPNFLGAAYLENWLELEPGARGRARPVFQRAFWDSEFVSRGFLSAVAALGRDASLALLPEARRPLRAALAAFSRSGDVEGAAILLPRMERAERRERLSDLRKIEERYRFGDLAGLRESCLAWVVAYPVRDHDQPEGRAQTARVLEVWPHDTIGPWRSDLRADLVRFFLNGRERDVQGEAVARAVTALSGVPDPVRARAKLLAGELSGAQTLVRNSETIGSFEWTPFFLALAQYELKQKRVSEARRALEKLAPAARDECDALLVRRRVAQALGSAVEVDAINHMLSLLQGDSFPPDAWSADGTLSLCLDPEETRGLALSVRLTATRPALVRYGWDGGRLGSLLVRDNAILAVPLAGLAGRRAFSVSVIVGEPIRPTGTLLRNQGQSRNRQGKQG